MRTIRVLALAAAVLADPLGASGLDLPKELGPESRACVGCHRKHTPGVVHDWLRSRHAWTRPEAALEKPAITRRLSVGAVPEDLGGRVVGCFECHGQRPESHADTFDHMGYRIHVVVTPKDCDTCHPVEVKEYAGSKKAYALENLAANPLFGLLVEASVGGRAWGGGRTSPLKSTPETRWETCHGCHGTEVTVRGLSKIQTAVGELEVPDLANWPNQGVGRVNPDGSRGACTSCHARHAFSLEEARRPETCSQCHLEPDSPAWDVYRASKHGSLYATRELDIDWENVPWVLGRDFTSPTCAACHASLVVNDEGATIAPRSHDFGARLWVRLLGLPYAHPQPASGETHLLRNAEGQPLPVALDGRPADRGLIAPEEQSRRRAVMGGVCNGCHSRPWVEAHFRKLDATVRETDAVVGAATKLVQEAWTRGLADPANPFDEPLEHLWLEGWLFYANSIRYTSAMAGAPAYATFRNGWWSLNRSLDRLEGELKRAAGARKPGEPAADQREAIGPDSPGSPSSAR